MTEEIIPILESTVFTVYIMIFILFFTLIATIMLCRNNLLLRKQNKIFKKFLFRGRQ